MNISGLISGIITALIGVGLLTGAYCQSEFFATVIMAVSGIAFVLVGGYILFNLNREDEIEKIKSIK